MNEELKLDGSLEKSRSIIFSAGEPSEEMIRLEPGKFFWKGKEVKDINKIYERFSEWMTFAEKVK